MRFPMGLRSS